MRGTSLKKSWFGFSKAQLFFKKINCNEHVPTGDAVLHTSSQLGHWAGPLLFLLGFGLGGVVFFFFFLLQMQLP